ncbi:hypothetical protein Droror1_Dr00023903 [Drosera rotundifolia]
MFVPRMGTIPPWRSNKCGGLQVAIALALLWLFSFSFLTSDSSASATVKIYHSNPVETKSITNSKLVLGSRPPRCINRCMNCRPCEAVLVIPPHAKPSDAHNKNAKITPQVDDEGYYLLSWKCRCKNMLFHP